MLIKEYIIQQAQVFGFSNVRFAKAEFMDKEAKRLEMWLNQGKHGTMSYMGNHFDLRVDPTKLVEGAKTVISFTYNYFPKDEQLSSGKYKIARYAYGKDYHKIIRKKLQNILYNIRENYGSIQGRPFVDSAPILERDWARRSGVGWVGKNTLLISKSKGSYFFLCQLIVDIKITPDLPINDYCGTCTRCIDACPTDAIDAKGYSLDSRKCISYATIELKEDIPKIFETKMEDWMYGCDICQEVCPWNRFSSAHDETRFEPKQALLEMEDKDWEDLTELKFDSLFEGSAIRRTKYTGLKRNIQFLE